MKFSASAILFYGTEACPITSADKHSLEFTINKVLYKIFGAMSKDTYGEICKYFAIDKVEESISHRQEKFVKTYSGYSNSLTRYPLGCDMFITTFVLLFALLFVYFVCVFT